LVIQADQGQNLDSASELLNREGYEVAIERASPAQGTKIAYLYAVRPQRGKQRTLPQSSSDGHTRSLSATDLQIVTPVSLRRQLKESLPPYMVPAAFVLMEKFPLNANGKIDRKALPVFTHDLTQHSHDFVIPRNETEQKLAAIWSDLLKVENIGVDDNFFDLGGHSLLAIKAVSRIRDLFEVDLPAQILFENSTIAELAKLLARTESAPGAIAPRIERLSWQGFSECGPSCLSR